MRVEVEHYADAVVRIHLDIHNRNGSLDACAHRKLVADMDKGWRNIASWALSYKGYRRTGDISWLVVTPTAATFTAPATKGYSKSERRMIRETVEEAFRICPTVM